MCDSRDHTLGSSLHVALKILALCTGNAARSVMLGYMLSTIAETNGANWVIRTAGTHVAEGAAMSSRTRDALLRIPELGDHSYGAHRGHQLSQDDVEWSDVILASEALHVLFVRLRYPHAAAKSVSFGQFIRSAPLDEPFVDQVSFVSSQVPDSAFDVDDPAGQDQLAYDECARSLWDMAQVFATLVE
jgi:protein-tyrosine-phosphatase